MQSEVVDRVGNRNHILDVDADPEAKRENF